MFLCLSHTGLAQADASGASQDGPQALWPFAAESAPKITSEPVCSADNFRKVRITLDPKFLRPEGGARTGFELTYSVDEPPQILTARISEAIADLIKDPEVMMQVQKKQGSLITEDPKKRSNRGYGFVPTVQRGYVPRSSKYYASECSGKNPDGQPYCVCFTHFCGRMSEALLKLDHPESKSLDYHGFGKYAGSAAGLWSSARAEDPAGKNWISGKGFKKLFGAKKDQKRAVAKDFQHDTVMGCTFVLAAHSHAGVVTGIEDSPDGILIHTVEGNTEAPTIFRTQNRIPKGTEGVFRKTHRLREIKG
ncbi:hypothetical protein WDW86_14870, partial [Bdellovibrionota bacterium FG-2]